MSQVDQGAAASAIEGPPSFMPPPAYSIPTADPHSDARLDQLTQAFGGPHQPTSAPLSIEDSHQQSSAMDQPQASSSWGKTLFKPFDWTSQHPQPGKEIMTADKTSEDNPMRYKRRSRRVSLMTSEGAAIFQFDVPNSDSSAANNSTTTTLTNNNIIASAPPSSEDQSRPQFLQFVQGSSDVSIDPPETVGPSSGLIVNRRGRRSSLSEIVEQENIKAGQDPEKLPVIVETTVDLLQQTNSAEDPAKRKKKSSVFNSWFFRSPDYNPDESDSAQTTAPPTPTAPESRKTSTSSNPNLEGIGGGQLTSKVVDALGLKSPSRKESRQMNVWMPQGM